MTKDDIFRMARESGMTGGTTLITDSSSLQIFASLVAAQAAAEEREACAMVSIYLGSTRIAAAIRERK